MRNLALLIALLLLAISANAQTVIPAGPIQGNWNQADSPYHITGNINIAEGTSLTVGPGVEVIFLGAFSLNVAGSITTNGLAGSPVVFTAQDTLNGWSSIRLSNTGTGINPPSVFNGTEFLYGRAIWGSGGQDPLNFGGAIWADNAGLLSFYDCSFNRCRSAQDGSAIYAKNNSSIKMVNCTVKDCESGFFGGVFVKEGRLELDGCQFIMNTALTFAAGVYLFSCTTAEINSCRFVDNFAGAVTGIYSFESPLKVKNSLFASNATDTGLGAGIGAIYGTATITNCTFYDNYSSQGGAAAWFNSLASPALLTNCIFWQNQVSPLQVNSTSYELSYCSTQSQEGDATNIYGDPGFSDPLVGDLSLSASSLCIDAGSPDTAGLELPDLDLEGMPRIVDGDNDGIARIDIGCFEWQPPILDGSIEGLVSDGEGQALAGALLTIGEISVSTDATGFYSFTLPAGSYDVSCSHEGYTAESQNDVVVEPGLVTTLNFILDAVDCDDPTSPQLTNALLGNYPNPFHPSTSIAYSLAKVSPVWIGIYNLKGQLLRTLMNQQQSRGIHWIDFDGRDASGSPVAKGIYLYRIKTPGFDDTRKMVLK